VTLDQYSTQELVNEAIEQGLVENVIRADGWVFIYFESEAIRLTEAHLRTFLFGILDGVRSCQENGYYRRR
jgi:hypothetical protein